MKQALSSFTYMLHGLARVYRSSIRDVLCIGLGVGIVPTQFAQEGAHVVVVEINPAVLPLAKRFFDLDPSRFNLIIDDGRHFVNRSVGRYDVIILDAFLGDSAPSHLMSREAFAAMHRMLKPGGVLVINTLGGTGDSDFLTASLNKTLQAVFRSVRVHDSLGGNVFFVASDQAQLEMQEAPDLSAVHPSSLQEVKEAYSNLTKPDPADGLILSDDYNPVEYYDAANQEQLRRRLAMALQQ